MSAYRPPYVLLPDHRAAQKRVLDETLPADVNLKTEEVERHHAPALGVAQVVFRAPQAARA